MTTKSITLRIDEYLKAAEALSGFSTALKHVKSQNIIKVCYPQKPLLSVGSIDTNNRGVAVVWFYLRRITESTRLPALMHLVLYEAKALHQNQQSFDLVIDSTCFDQDDALQVFNCFL